MPNTALKYATLHEARLIVLALNGSAERWEDWSKQIADPGAAKSFANQAAEALKLAKKIEED